MKKKLITALATKFEGVDAKILTRIADKIMSDKTIETDEDVNSAVDEVTFSDVLKSYGDSRATDATKTAVLNYEKKHKIKDGKPIELEPERDEENPEGTKQKPTKVTQNDELAELLKRMSDKMDAQAEEIRQLKQGKVTESRVKRLNDAIKDLKDSQKKAYKRISLDNLSDEDFDALMNEVETEVEEMVKENKAAETAGFNPLFGGQNHSTQNETKATDAEVDAIVGKIVNL